MNDIVQKLLNNEENNHLLPFLWLRGEDEKTLREYVAAIEGAECKAFCVESRPHPDFVGERWWNDMDVILDEAKKRNMKVWILDDSHFPTGYAAGALEHADPKLCRQSIFCHTLEYKGSARKVKFDMEKLSHPPKYQRKLTEKILMSLTSKNQKTFNDDQIYSITAFGANREIIDLTGLSSWDKPAGNWQIAVCGLTRNCGPHRNYINMMNHESVSCLIKAVYEPHYEHYKQYFGNVIAGFFSDEPELGNGTLYRMHNKLGNDQDLPWSLELAEKLGDGFKNKLPLLWKNDYDSHETALARNEYMNAVSELVSKDFSMQLGDWCRSHGVEYIGHLIEDNDTSTCTGSGLGHYFRGIAGQDMAGIDVIGGQVIPGGEDKPDKTMLGIRNGGFFHYTLGKLGVSAAYLDEKKKGRTMCEIFGNYGWACGVYDMKYLADHCLVRGVNYFVPHAFSAKKYPDVDCPPHFYAHGNHAQYRHFGKLLGYMNRVSNLISGGKIVTRVAILYNAESEWAGEAMLLDKPARILYDNQIDFCIIPFDSIEKAKEFDYLIVPYGQYWPEQLEKVGNAVFIDALPDNIRSGRVIKLSELKDFLINNKQQDIIIHPQNKLIHCMHYQTDNDMYMFINEGNENFEGSIQLPSSGKCYSYNAWDNQLEMVEAVKQVDGDENEKTVIACKIEPRKSFIVIFDETVSETDLRKPIVLVGEKKELSGWKRSICRSVDYPNFKEEKTVTLPDKLEEEKKKFSGLVRYETSISSNKRITKLEITDAAEGVEVLVNDVSAGIQIVPHFVYDITPFMKEGVNSLRIEVATTLARENTSIASKVLSGLSGGAANNAKSGICGKVYLYQSDDI